MHAIHSILVHIPETATSDEKDLNKMTKEEIKERVIKYAENYTDCFYGFVFDGRELLDDEPVLFASDNWDTFEEVLLAIDMDQKNYAKHMLGYLKEEAGSTAWALKQIANLIHGDYTFDSEFYDTSRGTALVPFIAQLKENPDEWALVQFDYHM